ncbi:unnamed protein product, partial [Ectocarpus sp. 12 AP-2014]
MRTRGRALKDPEPVVEVALEEAKGSDIAKDTPAAAPQPEESKGEETAPVATAVESAEAKAADTTVSGENGNGIAPPAGAAADNSGANSNDGDVKPPIQNSLEGAAPVSAADDAKPTNAVAGASNSNGMATASSSGPGNGEVAAAGAAVDKEGAENGEITAGDIKPGKDDKNSGGEEGKKTGGAAAGDADMEVEPPPKEDVMVDYTDEFGRVRQMLQ